jgi:hypothetical protein
MAIDVTGKVDGDYTTTGWVEDYLRAKDEL